MSFRQFSSTATLWFSFINYLNSATSPFSQRRRFRSKWRNFARERCFGRKVGGLKFQSTCWILTKVKTHDATELYTPEIAAALINITLLYIISPILFDDSFSLLARARVNNLTVCVARTENFIIPLIALRRVVSFRCFRDANGSRAESLIIFRLHPIAVLSARVKRAGFDCKARYGARLFMKPYVGADHLDFMIDVNRGFAKLIRSGFIQSLSSSFNSDTDTEWFSSGGVSKAGIYLGFHFHIKLIR